MALVATHRQVVYRLLAQRRSTWRLLERTLEDQRQLYNAALEERIDCYRKTGRLLTFFDRCKALTQCRRDDPEVAACAAMSANSAPAARKRPKLPRSARIMVLRRRAQSHFATGGRLIRTAFASWPVSKPNFVPRS